MQATADGEQPRGQGPAERPSPGRVRLKALRAFSTIMAQAEELLQHRGVVMAQQQPLQQQGGQGRREVQASFPASCAIALLRGMVRVLSVAVVEDRLEARWLKVAAQLAGCVACLGSSSSGGSSSSDVRDSSTSSSSGGGSGSGATGALSVQQVVTCAWAATKLGLTPARLAQPPALASGAAGAGQAAAELWVFLRPELQRVSPRMNAMEVREPADAASAHRLPPLLLVVGAADPGSGGGGGAAAGAAARKQHCRVAWDMLCSLVLMCGCPRLVAPAPCCCSPKA